MTDERELELLRKIEALVVERQAVLNALHALETEGDNGLADGVMYAVTAIRRALAQTVTD